MPVLSRVRSQSSFGFPIAPQNIPSWIPLLHTRSRPTGRRHVNIRCTTVPCGVVRLNHSCVSIVGKPTPKSSIRLRLNQTHGGFCQNRSQCNQFSHVLLRFILLFSTCSFVVNVLGLTSLEPSRHRRVGRFASSRTLPGERRRRVDRDTSLAHRPKSTPGPSGRRRGNGIAIVADRKGHAEFTEEEVIMFEIDVAGLAELEGGKPPH